MVQDAVEHRRNRSHVTEQLSPVFDGTVGCQQRNYPARFKCPELFF
jgi:hypothetical protein